MVSRIRTGYTCQHLTEITVWAAILYVSSSGIAGHIARIVHVKAVRKAAARIADIAPPEQQVLRDLTLDGEIPHLIVGRLKSRIERADESKRREKLGIACRNERRE